MKALFVALLLAPSLAVAQVPQKIGYQGRLLKSDGTPESGSPSATFEIFGAATGGSALWTETRTLALVDGFTR